LRMSDAPEQPGQIVDLQAVDHVDPRAAARKLERQIVTDEAGSSDEGDAAIFEGCHHLFTFLTTCRTVSAM